MAPFDEDENAILARSLEPVPTDPRDRNDLLRLQDILLDHLDWYSAVPSPFISVSRDREWAFNEARRRGEQGNTNVVVHEICITRAGLRQYYKYGNPQICWKGVREWLHLAGLETTSTYAKECLFLHHIPGEFITETFEPWKEFGMGGARGFQ